MIPKKLIFFGLLVFAGVAYLLKDQSLSKLQSKSVQQDMKVREGAQKIRSAEEQEKERMAKLLEEAKEKGHRFLAGQCVSNHKDGWEFTKILGIGEGTYRLIDCHKYKGCTEQKELPWQEIEFEYRSGRIVECSR